MRAHSPRHSLRQSPDHSLMRSIPSVIVGCSVALSFGCSNAQPVRALHSSTDTLTSAHTSAQEGSLERAHPPASVKPLRSALRARHTSDLPQIDQLRRIKDYERGLMWLTLFGSPLQVRARASLALGEVEGTQALDILLRSAHNAKRASLKAAALRGLKSPLTRLSASDPRRSRIIVVGREAIQSSDRRVREAARVLGELAPEINSVAPARAAESLSAP